MRRRGLRDAEHERQAPAGPIVARSSRTALLELQRTAGNRATTMLVQRHAASKPRNTFSAGGLTDVILTPEQGPQLLGNLSFQSGRVSGLEEVGAARPDQPHVAGLQNISGAGGLTNVIFTPESGPQIEGGLTFQAARLGGLTEFPRAVQRHAAQGLSNRFQNGGMSDLIFTSKGGAQIIGGLSFRSGRLGELTEETGPKPAPTGPRLLSRARGSQGTDVRAVQQRLNDLGEELAADRIFGPLTDEAVRRFQSAKSLNDDGVVGPKTRRALGL